MAKYWQVYGLAIHPSLVIDKSFTSYRQFMDKNQVQVMAKAWPNHEHTIAKYVPSYSIKSWPINVLDIHQSHSKDIHEVRAMS